MHNCQKKLESESHSFILNSGASTANSDKASSTKQQSPVEESLSTPFSSFAHAQKLVHPYDEELKRDIEFQDGTYIFSPQICTAHY